ncbi:MAG: hypothetical protein EA361_16605 [Bacteroidetes bacterium]|nr:MAG: hypothetical protein EA361_16605 [Bacteroidota bacterium]
MFWQVLFKLFAWPAAMESPHNKPIITVLSWREKHHEHPEWLVPDMQKRFLDFCCCIFFFAK